MADPKTGGAITGGNWGYTGGSSSSGSTLSSNNNGVQADSLDLSSYAIDPQLEEYEGTEDNTPELDQERAEKIAAIMACGYTETDAARLVDGEISPEDLYTEIYQEYLTAEDPSQTRFAALLKVMVYKDGFYYSREDIKQKRDADQEELDRIKNSNREEDMAFAIQTRDALADLVANAVLDPATGTYKYTNSKGKEVTLTEADMEQARESLAYWDASIENYDTNKERRISELEAEIAAYDKELEDTSREEFPYSSEEELDARLTDIETREAEIRARMAELPNAGYKMEDGKYVINDAPRIAGPDVAYEGLENADNLIENGTLDIEERIGSNGVRSYKRTIVPSDGTGGNIYTVYTDRKDNTVEEHITIREKDGKYYEVIEVCTREEHYGAPDTYKWETIERELPDSKVTIVIEDEYGNKEYFTSFNGSETLFYYWMERCYDIFGTPINLYKAMEAGWIELSDGRKIRISSIGTPTSPESRDTITRRHTGRAEYIQTNPGAAAEYNALADELRELEAEKAKLENKKQLIDIEYKWLLINAKYTMQPDFNEKKEFDYDGTVRNSTGLAAYVLPIGKSEFKFYELVNDPNANTSYKELMGALLAGIINNKAITYEDGKFYDRSDNCYLVAGDEGVGLIFQNFSDYAAKGAFTQEEIDIFNYICNTEGFEAGYEYLMSLYNELDGRYLAIRHKEDAEHARKSVFAGLESLGLAPYEAIVNMRKQYFRKASGQELKTSDAYSRAATYRETISSDIRRQYGAFWGDVFDITYSIEQSLINTMIVYASGGNPAVALLSTTIIMGTPVYNEALYSALKKGVDDDQAIAYALSCAIIEIAMESYSTVHLVGIASGFDKMMTSGALKDTVNKLVAHLPKGMQEYASKLLVMAFCAVSQGLVEFNEEYDTELLTNLAEFIFEGDLSESSRKYQQYIDLGYSEEEALIAVLCEVHKDGMQAGMYGFISGTILGGVLGNGSAVDTNVNSEYEGEIDTETETNGSNETGAAEEINTETEGYNGSDDTGRTDVTPVEEIDAKKLAEEYKGRPEMQNMTAIEKEQHLNELTNGRFVEALDAWQQGVFEQNLSNAIWDANKAKISKIMSLYGITEFEVVNQYGKPVKLKPKDFIKGNRIDTYALAQSIAAATGEDVNTVHQNIQQYLTDFPVQVDTEKIYLDSMEACMAVEDILIERYQNGDIVDLDKALEMVAVNKGYLQMVNALTAGEVTSSEIKNSQYYQEYVTEVISQERYDALEREMVPDGVEGKVYCVQQVWAFETFTAGKGNLGRTEGYYVISEARLIEALSEATGQTITAADVEQIMAGNTAGYNINKSKLAVALGFEENWFDSGATIVESPATPDSLRASLPTDEGANAYYVPGMQTSGGSNEMVNEQITGLKLEETSPGVYTDSSGQGVSAVTIK